MGRGGAGVWAGGGRPVWRCIDAVAPTIGSHYREPVPQLLVETPEI